MAITSEVKIKATFDGTEANNEIHKTDNEIKEVAKTTAKTSSVLSDMGRVLVTAFSAEKIKMFVKESVMLAAELDVEATASFKHLQDVARSFQLEVGKGILDTLKPMLPLIDTLLKSIIEFAKKSGAAFGFVVDAMANLAHPTTFIEETRKSMNALSEEFKAIDDEMARYGLDVTRKRLEEEAKAEEKARKERLAAFKKDEDKKKEIVKQVWNISGGTDTPQAGFTGTGQATPQVFTTEQGAMLASNVTSPAGMVSATLGSIPEIGGIVKAFWDAIVTISGDPNFWENFSKNSGILVRNIIANLIPALIRGLPMLMPEIMKGMALGYAELFQQFFDTETWARAGQNFLQPFRDFWKEFDDMWNRGELAEVLLDLANAMKRLTNDVKNLGGGGLGDISDNSVVGQIGNALGFRQAVPTIVIQGNVTGDITPAFARSVARIAGKNARQEFARITYPRL